MEQTSTILELRAEDELIKSLSFRPYRNSSERRAVQHFPGNGEPDELAVKTPWGETLYAKPGDYIVHEQDAAQDKWPVDREIFENSYIEVTPGLFVKRPLTYLVPLEIITESPEQMVRIYTMEGPVTVKAKEFYLARGIKGEIWPYPRAKADSGLVLAG
ncbi:MAG: hypothetical protein GY796_28580 [Chloroflexi bacterium]|nr:hypothetical protein [Chloroflexota bacterium]